MKHSIELTIVGLIILCCACAVHCQETNKAKALIIGEASSLTNKDGTAELKTDGPLSHFRLYGMVETQKVVIRQELTVVDVVTSNTYMHVYTFDDTAKAWRTNSKIPSAIAPVMLPPTTNVVATP